MLTYRHDGLSPFRITVKFDGKVCGYILRPSRDCYYYRARNGMCGETFDTLEGVKASLDSGTNSL